MNNMFIDQSIERQRINHRAEGAEREKTALLMFSVAVKTSVRPGGEEEELDRRDPESVLL